MHGAAGAARDSGPEDINVCVDVFPRHCFHRNYRARATSDSQHPPLAFLGCKSSTGSDVVWSGLPKDGECASHCSIDGQTLVFTLVCQML